MSSRPWHVSALAIFAASVPPPAVPPEDARLIHDWHLVEGRYWQIASSTDEPPDTTDSSEGTRGECGAGMVEVSGEMLAVPIGELDAVEASQRQTCVDWIRKTFPERCALFDEEKWRSRSTAFPTRPMHFCVDRFEYPNRRGAYPWVMVSWTEARALCARDGKRLCTEAEWTFACEGPTAKPYPYGYRRDDEICVTDRPWRPYDARLLDPRDTPQAEREVDRLWQGEPSGLRPRCRSDFGVYDLTGNVDEWTTSVSTQGRPSILKGGYWGPVRGRCRVSTRVHGPNVALYQQGFRCCGDAPRSE
jgi:formylglycine-generating enzyme required for sulfatase activity